MNRLPRRFGRCWTVTDLVLLTAGIVTVLVGLLAAQTPPLPPGAEPLPRPLTIRWDANPAADYYAATDTNGIPVPLVYRVRQSHSITNPLPWPVVAETTNTVAVLTNLTARTTFWYVTASNFFLESAPSRIVALPFEPGDNLRLIAE